MPREIFDVEEFIKLSEKASECRVKRLKDVVKLKLRTRRLLYTLKVDPDKASEIIRRVKCEIVEV
ncbi:50S ribosomal protein L38e [Candidatus Bathyarchaeota archaeon]|nr:MAG: 50S ribosomal protein L38e [Candidatus Bathyarchaeota archaeon]